MISADTWEVADGLILETNALLAVKELGKSLALTAGPGAGKTEVLAQRADFLLRTGNCRYPKRILAISFKVDASKNLKDRIRRRCGLDLAARFDSYTFHGFAKRIIDRFRPVLKGRDSLEPNYSIGDEPIPGRQIKFAQLIPLATKILSNSVVARNAICQTYADVFLDEFQDCTTEQYALLKLVFMNKPIRLTAVGDTKQKIMGWAGALDGIFVDYAKDFHARPLNLYRNFRSKPRLLRMQNEIIRTLDPAAVMADDLIIGNDGELIARNYDNSHSEAAALANIIQKWIDIEKIPLQEIAILFPRQIDLYGTPLMEQLAAKGIPYRNEHESQDLVNEPAARLIIDYLSCLYREREPKAWINLMEQLVSFNDEDGESELQRNFERLYLTQLKEVKKSAQSDAPYSGWWELTMTFLKNIGLPVLTTLSSDYEAKARLNEVIKNTRQQIEKLLDQEPDLLKALDLFSNDQAVRFLTIHKSKGLEFHSVIMIGVETQTFWGKVQEERCGFFVGVSRAKERLMITTCDLRHRPASNPPRWNEHRTPHTEFVTYVTPFLSAEPNA